MADILPNSIPDLKHPRVMEFVTLRLAGTAALLSVAGAASAQTPPSSQAFAAAFRDGDYEQFKAMIANERMAMVDRLVNVTALSRDDLVARLKPCAVDQVYEAGKNYQTQSGVAWI